MRKKTTKHGLCWWLFISWWWLPIKWLCFKLPAFAIRAALKVPASSKGTPKSNTPAPQLTGPAAPGGVTVKTYHTTGMSNRLENLLSLSVKNDDYNKSKKLLVEDGLIGTKVWEYEFYPSKVELIPEPDNPYDSNAIKVMVDGKHVSYIKKGSCPHLLKVIREGRIENIDCKIGGGKYKYICENDEDEAIDEDGNGEPTYTLEKDSINYYVWLYITERE